MLDAGRAVDAAEDAEYGRGQRGEELPAELARRESRLAKIREAKAALEAEARAAGRAKAAEAQQGGRAGTAGGRPKGRPATVPDPEQAQPDPKAQRNFTDPESRIMKDGATKAFVQAYNAQIAVDGDAQVIVAGAVTQEATDKKHLVPMVEQIEANTGQRPAVVLADAGYFSEEHDAAQARGVSTVYVPPDRSPHARAGGGDPRRESPVAAAMARRWATASGTGRHMRCARHRGAGVRADQGGAGLPPVPAARPARSERNGTDLPHPQSAQAVSGGLDAGGGMMARALRPTYSRPGPPSGAEPRPRCRRSSLSASHRTRINDRVLLLR